VVATVQGCLDTRGLSSASATATYRAVQEALNNVAKHAQATRVDITLGWDAGVLQCSIRDDGTGFDVSGLRTRRGAGGLGLIGMQERLNTVGGMLTIISAPGQGTELRITVPADG
jgi:signal transduction histidine kinase